MSSLAPHVESWMANVDHVDDVSLVIAGALVEGPGREVTIVAVNARLTFAPEDVIRVIVRAGRANESTVQLRKGALLLAAEGCDQTASATRPFALSVRPAHGVRTPRSARYDALERQFLRDHLI